MWSWLLDTPIIAGPVYPIVIAAAALSVALLLARPILTVRALVNVNAALAGALLGVAAVMVANANDTFGVELDITTGAWVTASFAATAVGIVNCARNRAWRRVIAAVSIPLALAAGTLGVNADFGLNKNVAELVGAPDGQVRTLPRLHLPPKATATPHASADLPLWAEWNPPAGMPAAGQVEWVSIPPTASGFHARPAGLYLPPAALVRHPPALPLMIMMMGQPGNPDPSFAGNVLNRFAATHKGLAPIVLVPDQLGNPADDTLCLNTSKFGNVETYLTQDVVGWARTHLHIDQDPSHWVISGYSNGGECALSLAAKYPGLWHNLLDISGEDYPGADAPAATLARVFHGDRAAYAGQNPLGILEAHRYVDSTAIFTVGSNDSLYVPQARAADAAAAAAGWNASLDEVPNGGHVLGALMGGLSDGFTALYPRLGLSP